MFTGVCAGLRTVIVTDSKGCTDTKQITITSIGGPTLALTPTPASCPEVCDGKITVAISGGTSPYTCSIDGAAARSCVSGDIFTALCTGVHSVMVTDSRGCVDAKSVNLGAGAPPTLTLA